jgi:hypothetical protein
MTRMREQGTGADETAVDTALAALRAAPPPAPSAALMARVLADAAAVQRRARRPGLAARLAAWAGSGGWAAPGFGLAGAAAGLAFGLMEPVPLDLWPLSGGSEVALLSEADLLAALGEDALP